MKKTILAVAIAATSFGASAYVKVEPIHDVIVAPVPVPDLEPIMPIGGFKPDAGIKPIEKDLEKAPVIIVPPSVSPIEDVITPVNPEPTPVKPIEGEGAKGVVKFNSAMIKLGKEANIVKNKSGNYEVSFEDGQGNQVTKEITEDKYAEVIARASKVREGSKDAVEAYIRSNNGDVGVTPDPIAIDPQEPVFGVNPIEGEPEVLPTPQGTVLKAAAANQASTQAQMDELYALGNQNATDINTLFNEVDRLDSKIDGVAAMSQASLAARPYLSTNQTSSVGVGIGGAGSEAAFALGYAHRMTENWTANANVAVNTGDSAEASYGAGVSYAW